MRLSVVIPENFDRASFNKILNRKDLGIEINYAPSLTEKVHCQFLVLLFRDKLETLMQQVTQATKQLSSGTKLWVLGDQPLDQDLVVGKGANGYLKANGPAESQLAIRLLAELALYLPKDGLGFQGMIGISAVMKGLYSRISRFAKMDKPALILGRHGVGKGLVAQALHASSGRPGKILKVNLAAISEGLLESELFGHVKGAFTGAETDRKGLIAEVGKGTIFLDEIGELKLDLQAKLLSVTEDNEVRRVGANQFEPISARMVFATNRDLVEASANKEFREDLYRRLNYFSLQVPSLNERREDILIIASHLLKAICKKQGRSLDLTPTCNNQLFNHDWDGNVRELEGAIEQAAVFSDGEMLSSMSLQDIFQAERRAPKESLIDPLAKTYPEYQEWLKQTYFRRMLAEIPSKAKAYPKSGLSKARFYEMCTELGL